MFRGLVNGMVGVFLLAALVEPATTAPAAAAAGAELLIGTATTDITPSRPVALAGHFANRFLFRPFWLGQPDAAAKLKRAVQRCLRDYNDGSTLAVLQETFERLYVLRTQVFHGAATSGNRLNRATLERAVRVLEALVPEMLRIIIDAGPTVDWGEVCFPPREE